MCKKYCEYAPIKLCSLVLSDIGASTVLYLTVITGDYPQKIIQHSIALHMYIHMLPHLPHRDRVSASSNERVRASARCFMSAIMNIEYFDDIHNG